MPETCTVRTEGETFITRYDLESVILREDGLYEVICRIEPENSEEGRGRYLFSEDRVLLGSRETYPGSGDRDSVQPFDTTWDSYIAGLGDRIDRIEGEKVYFKDGGYEEVELLKKRIVRFTQYTAEGRKSADISLSRFGQVNTLKFYGEDGKISYSVEYSYSVIQP